MLNSVNYHRPLGLRRKLPTPQIALYADGPGNKSYILMIGGIPRSEGQKTQCLKGLGYH